MIEMLKWKKKLDEIQVTENKQWEFELQQNLVYWHIMEEDKWVDVFFYSIKKSIYPTSFEILKKYISKSAKYFMDKKLKK